MKWKNGAIFRGTRSYIKHQMTGKYERARVKQRTMPDLQDVSGSSALLSKKYRSAPEEDEMATRGCRCGKTERTVLVSRLVAMTWCPGYREGLTVNHIDGNSLNNCAKNLEWVSIAENIRKGFDAGLFARNQKAVVLKRDSEKLSFVSMAEAGRYIGRSNKYISDCVKAGRKARALDGRSYDILSA